MPPLPGTSSSQPSSAAAASPVEQPTFRVKEPDGRLRELTRAQVQRDIRAGKILAWDQVAASDDGDRFAPVSELTPFQSLFRGRDAIHQKRCWEHPSRHSSLICRRCGRGFCENSAPQAERPGLTIRVCFACEGLLEPADPRWREKRFWKRLDEVAAFPLKEMSWVTTVGIGALVWIGSMGLRGLLVYAVGLAFFVHIIARSAKGEKKMGIGPETTDPLELAGTGVAVVIATLTVALPLILFNFFVVYRGLSDGEEPGSLFLLNIPMAIAALAYYPMAIGMSAVWHNKWLSLRPDIVIGHILKIQRDYAILVGFCAAITLTQWFIESLAWIVPVFGGLASGIVSAYLGVIEAHIIGWTLYMNHEELGWG
ncbi:MAG TPA: hypothetical protein VLK65_15740 [Vicinamibacteria bacterium]|nr:hypothetical protein [Vicinamibacteria bacterium]